MDDPPRSRALGHAAPLHPAPHRARRSQFLAHAVARVAIVAHDMVHCGHTSRPQSLLTRSTFGRELHPRWRQRPLSVSRGAISLDGSNMSVVERENLSEMCNPGLVARIVL